MKLNLLTCGLAGSRFLKFSFAVAVVVAGFRAQAAVINASNGSFTAVSAAVAQASAGDTVLIPAGTNSWPGILTISGITLAGQGADKTVILDESPMADNGSPLIQLNANNSQLTRVTGIQFSVGVTNKLPYQNYKGALLVSGPAPLWRIDHCQFTYMTAKPVHVGDASYGLIDHCSFLMKTTANAIEIFDTGYGDSSWAAPSVLGSSNAVYIEDNYIYSANNFAAVDVSNGGRVVFRNNTMNGCFFNTHGTETSQRFRSARYVEIYNNSFTWGGGAQYNNFYTACDLRGGTAVVFSNSFVGFWGVASINYYRATDNDPQFVPFFGATGLRAWDSNSPALLTGTAAATTNALIVPGAAWTADQWAGCTVYNNRSGLSGIVAANSATSMTFKPSRTPSLQISFQPNDAFTIHRVYPMMDQPGVGQCDLLTGDSPTPVWLHFTPDPMYFWGNSLAVVYQTPTAAPATAGSGYPNVQENRDFFNNTPRPNYTPFTYPHPLTLITNSVGVTNTVVPPPTNSVPVATNNLVPPTGLIIQPL